jgi:UDP-glucose 4-epimerase
LNVAITGVAGFVGSNLAERLLARGDVVSGIDDLSHGTLENLAGIMEHPRFRLRKGTILDPAAVRAAMEGAEVVIHLAAGKIPRYGDALETLRTNGLGGFCVLDGCVAERVRRLVFASTSDCYGRNREVPFSEQTPSVLGGPHVKRWAYAVSKMFEEQALFGFRERHGLQAVILRLFGGYGPHQNLTWWGGPQSVFIGAALRGEELELHGTGQQTRSFTYVDDMVDAFVSAADTPAADGELFNVGNDTESTIEELARLVWRLVRSDEPRIRLVPYASFGRYEDVERRVPDNRHAAEVLGVQPKVALEEGLRRTIPWHRSAMERAGLL